MASLYPEKRPYTVKPSVTTGARNQVSVPGLGLLLGMGAGEADGDRRGQWGPQASSLIPESTSTED